MTTPVSVGFAREKFGAGFALVFVSVGPAAGALLVLEGFEGSVVWGFGCWKMGSAAVGKEGSSAVVRIRERVGLRVVLGAGLSLAT